VADQGVCSGRNVAGVWGRGPQLGPKAEPLVRGSGGRSLPEAEEFSHQKTEELGKFATLLSIL